MANAIIKKWELMFMKDWKDTMGKTMAEFTDFVYGEGDKQSIEFTDPVCLGGLAYGKEGFPDGSDICTSVIVRVERVPMSTNIAELMVYGADGNRFIATTKSGTCYEFVELGPDGMSPHQFLMMGTIMHGHLLKKCPF